MPTKYDDLLRDIYVDIVRDKLWTEVPRTLWHYTTIDALFGIIQSREIWLSDTRQLNDKNEVVHSIEEIAEICNSIVEKNRLLNEILATSLGRFSALDVVDSRMFVFSLSKKKDDLNQWKGYSAKPSGVSIGFDLANTDSIWGQEENEIYIAKVIYDRHVKQGMICEYFSRLKKLTDGKRMFTPNEMMDILIQVDLFLEMCAICFKDREWQNESEYRVVAVNRSFKNIRFRQNNGRIVPYGFIGIDPVESIRSIILLDSDEYRKRTLVEYLSYKKMKGTDVSFAKAKMRF